MDDDVLLEILLRERPTSVAAAASAVRLDVAQAAAKIRGFRERGLVGGDGDTLTYPAPAGWATEAVAAHTRQLRAATEEALTSIETILDALPTALRAWAVGEAATDEVYMVVRYGPYASEDLRWELSGRPSGDLVAVFTSIDHLVDAPAERAARFSESLSEGDAVRVIVPTSAATDPLRRERMTLYGRVGLQYRSLSDVPGWFWVHGDFVALPHTWGEATPTGVLGVRHAGLANLMRAFFDELWRRATPVGAKQEPWTSILQLMREGHTLDGASYHLGINARTGRRRVAAAMDHYETRTLFELASAWAAAGADGTAAAGSGHGTASPPPLPGPAAP
ncbi:hypothetical protein [Microbacterium sp. lyk4-40-TSB-66]|uniref:hypothetical protein n=1 Tax=Microbacterium sp. lyk4-40-TSB-66 TaxID=3040294 RepID=UPI00254E8F3E|nr:hypothetical protein [Microbacterium sp. lyk4-40-TSB-66]